MHYRLNESDLFKRLLFLSIAERIQEEEIAKDRQRLEAFIASRPEELSSNITTVLREGASMDCSEYLSFLTVS